MKCSEMLTELQRNVKRMAANGLGRAVEGQ